MSEPRRHLSDWTLEQMLEGELPAGERAAAEGHVEQCRACAGELAAYRSLFTALADLPRFEPSPSFADAVMARTRLAPEPSAFALWLRRITPTTRRGWAFLIALLVAPLLPLIAAWVWLLTHPMLTAGALWSWVVLQVRTSAGTTGQVLLGWARETGVTTVGDWLYALSSAVPLSAITAVLVVFGAGIPLSAWVLFRLVRTPTRNIKYAN